MSAAVTGQMNLTPSLATASVERQKAALRQAVGEMMGHVFYAPMLSMARDSVPRGKFGHGGRGEDVFAAQLNQELARRMGMDTANELTEAVYDELAKGIRA